MEQEGYGELEVDSKVEMIRALVPLGLMHVHELLDAEVSELAGERYVRKSETVQGRRHGTNPGTVKLAGQRVPIRVPRVRGRDGEIPLSSYESLSHRGEVDELLLRRVLYGISCRNYESVPWCTTPIEADSSLGPDSHHPIISLSGIPRAVMVFRILHPILASTLCAANPLARIAEPTIAL